MAGPRRRLPLVGPRPFIGAGQSSLDLVITILLIVIAILPSLLMARGYLVAMSVPGDPIEPFSDAITYLAAGERLNAGHDLYRLVPGDRPVLILPQTFDAPLVSPPPIAAIWRPIAALPFGFLLWIVAVWVALLGTMIVLVRRCGLPAVIACVVLTDGVAQQLSVGNVAAFFPALLVLAWDHRSSPPVASVLGLMTALKIAPGTMFGWLLGRRDRAAFLWAVGAAAALVLISVAGSGIGAWLEYGSVATHTRPSPESLSGATGLPWLSFMILVVGTIAAVLVGLVRRDGWSFSIAVAASVLGTPALYHAGFVPLFALLAPLAEHLRVGVAQAEMPARSKPDPAT